MPPDGQLRAECQGCDVIGHAGVLRPAVGIPLDSIRAYAAGVLLISADVTRSRVSKARQRLEESLDRSIHIKAVSMFLTYPRIQLALAVLGMRDKNELFQTFAASALPSGSIIAGHPSVTVPT